MGTGLRHWPFEASAPPAPCWLLPCTHACPGRRLRGVPQYPPRVVHVGHADPSPARRHGECSSSDRMPRCGARADRVCIQLSSAFSSIQVLHFVSDCHSVPATSCGRIEACGKGDGSNTVRRHLNRDSFVYVLLCFECSPRVDVQGRL